MKLYEAQAAGRTLRARVEPELAPQLNTLFSVVDTIPQDRLVDGFTLSVGWGAFQLREADDGFELLGADYMKDPFVDWTENLTLGLWAEFEQAALLRQLRVEGQPLKFSDKIVVQKGALDAPSIYLQRSEPKPGDSGWYIGKATTDDNDAPVGVDDLESIRAYTLLTRRPQVVRVLGLPTGYLVGFDGDKIDAVFDDRDELVSGASVGDLDPALTPSEPSSAVGSFFESRPELVDAAARFLKTDKGAVLSNHRDLPEDAAVYVWQPVRGGSSVILAADGSVLWANSSIPFEQHLEAFRAGRRTDPQAFSA